MWLFFLQEPPEDQTPLKSAANDPSGSEREPLKRYFQGVGNFLKPGGCFYLLFLRIGFENNAKEMRKKLLGEVVEIAQEHGWNESLPLKDEDFSELQLYH